MNNKNVLRLKDRPSVVNYIQLLQGNISRMSSHSGIIKASICVIYTVLITILIAINKMSDYWWIAVLISVIGSIVDAYYLGMEKIYVIKYNSFVEELNNGIIDDKKVYDMKPRNTELKAERLAMILSSLTSFSIWGFYLALIMISVFIKFV